MLSFACESRAPGCPGLNCKRPAQLPIQTFSATNSYTVIFHHFFRLTERFGGSLKLLEV